MLNTEIPFHRPPFILQYQQLFKLPLSSLIIKKLLKSKIYRHSKFGYGGCFYNKKLIDGEFERLIIEHFISSDQCFAGLREYLVQLNFNIIDTLDDIHSTIIALTQYIWGKEDTIFPCELGREMANKMTACKEFIDVSDTCFLPHEEQPLFVAEKALMFLSQQPD